MLTRWSTLPAVMPSVQSTLQPAACALASTIASKNETLRVWWLAMTLVHGEMAELAFIMESNVY